MLGKNYI